MNARYMVLSYCLVRQFAMKMRLGLPLFGTPAANPRQPTIKGLAMT